MPTTSEISDPVVRALIDAINAGDRDAFYEVLTPDATMSDDGADRDLDQWVDQEIFSANGRLEVESATDDGRSLIANYRNDRWGAMRTAWRFVVSDGRISRFETGQA
ncbi:nuclear transport factor 2 family protein [Amycolatopsis anabasis]|uniref:nuclear transport factor 2 family protein n=1 Tax=Amycolatopsis anabasis TaxID=1840409 RepID=UPI00131ACA32|nr:nuclear transport factor 2 family protein [Amycolatopsis anabasis]